MESKLWFEEYDDYVNESAQYKDPTYALLGLVGEGGEVLEAAQNLVKYTNMTAEKVKKEYRTYGIDWADLIEEDKLESLLKELGDVLWYTSRLAGLLGSSLEEVAEMNMEKLDARRSQRAGI